MHIYTRLLETRSISGRLLALLLSLMLVLTAVGCSDSNKSDDDKTPGVQTGDQNGKQEENKDEGKEPDEVEMMVVTGDYTWWEAEAPLETNFPEKTTLSLPGYTKEVELFSGGNWITNNGMVGDDEPYIKYEIDAAEEGQYYLSVRKLNRYGAFKWRVNDGEWISVPATTAEQDFTTITGQAGLVWVNGGQAALKKGKNVFELRLLSKKGFSAMSGYDCFVFSRSVFTPNGLKKPDEKSGLAEEGWWAFEPSGDSFSESPIDLRYLNEEYAGKNGFVRRDGENIVLGDGTPVRFWAVNVGPGIIDMDKTSIDYLAKHLAKHGVNMVRLHGAVYDQKNGELTKVDEKHLDNIFYFVSAMKKEGIYSSLSTYFPLWVDMVPEYGFEGYETIDNKNPFGLLQFNEKFQAIYKDWAKTLLNTTNPYTGVTLAEDPAVAMIEVQNEDNYLFWTFTRNNIPEPQMQILEKIFGTWLKNKYGSIEKALSVWGEGSKQVGDAPDKGIARIMDIWYLTADGHGTGGFSRRMSDQLQFLVEHQKKFYDDMIRYYRKDLNVKSMISCSNWTTADARILDSLERYTYTSGDIIDRHAYFDHKHEGPNSSWSVQVGQTYENVSVLTQPEMAIFQVNQVADYPAMISETGWPSPNGYKAESVALWSAYGSMEGMDAIVFFAVGSVNWQPSKDKFALMIPSVLGQFPGYALMYRRGDVKEAEAVVKVVHSLKDLYNFKGSPIYENQALDQARK